MGDVAKILSGEAAAAAASSSLPPPPPPPPASHHPSRAMKMTGVSREVMDLLSGRQETKSASLPPVVPTIPPAVDTTVKVGNKYISAKKPAKKWVWAPFNSSARADGALFRHWVRAGVEYPDYPYARFDIHLDSVVYTDEEYRRFLQDASWTKSETDALMELARVFELRWAVIYDRWCDTQSQGRCVEDLQHRYYTVAALLTQARVAKEAAAEASALASNVPVADPNMAPERANAIVNNHLMETAAARALATAELAHQPLIETIGTGSTNKKVFDLEKERERRKHMDFIWNRSKEEELEEAQLRKELRLLDTQIRKLKKSGGHILAAAANRGTASIMSSAASSANPSRSVSPVNATNVEPDSVLLDQCFASTAPTPMPGTPYLQSGRLNPPAAGAAVGISKTTLKRMESVLEELNVASRPLPSKRVCDLYDSVRKDALTLLILQKMVLQREGQLQTKRLRLAKMGGGGRIVDEETLLGIAPAAPSAPSGGGNTSRSKASTGTKGKRSTTGKAKVGAKSPAGEAGKAAAAAAVQASGGKTVPGGKAARKPGGKRKKKTDSATATVSGAAGSGLTATEAAAVQGSKRAATDDGGESKSAKKRARKS